jgi:hypothetical protein
MARNIARTETTRNAQNFGRETPSNTKTHNQLFSATYRQDVGDDRLHSMATQATNC